MRFVHFKTQGNSTMGTWSSGKQGPYFNPFEVTCLFQISLDDWQSGDASCGSKNHESAHYVLPLLENILGVEVLMIHHPIGQSENSR